MKEINNDLSFRYKTAFHYSNLESLFKILSSKKLWLTSLSSTNDKKELKIGQNILIKALDNLVTKEKDPEIIKLIDAIKSASDEKVVKSMNRNQKYYATAFVCIPDSLTHWERYGDQSKGVCIEFNLKMLEQIFLNIKDSDFFNNWIKQEEIIYKYEEQLKFIEEELFFQINKMRYLLRNRSKNNDLSNYKPLYNNRVIPMLIYHSLVSTIEPIFKHKGFSDEYESRLFFSPGEIESTIKTINTLKTKMLIDKEKKVFLQILNNILKKLELNQEEVRYSVINGRIRSLYTLNLSSIWNSLLIPKIIIGPKCTQNEKELRDFVKSTGLKRTKILASKIPIR